MFIREVVSELVSPVQREPLQEQTGVGTSAREFDEEELDALAERVAEIVLRKLGEQWSQ